MFHIIISATPPSHRMVKEFVTKNEFNSIKIIIASLKDDFTLSSNPNSRKGGLVGLAATAIALGRVCVYIISICMCVSTCVCMYVCTYVRMYAHTYVCKYVCTYVHMYVCKFVCMYVHTYVCMYHYLLFYIAMYWYEPA